MQYLVLHIFKLAYFDNITITDTIIASTSVPYTTDMFLLLKASVKLRISLNTCKYNLSFTGICLYLFYICKLSHGRYLALQLIPEYCSMCINNMWLPVLCNWCSRHRFLLNQRQETFHLVHSPWAWPWKPYFCTLCMQINFRSCISQTWFLSFALYAN